ncbi:polysaccharide deacetylase family protein [Sporomusa acidovorans]|uniref:polysaccharide deacetylase family protein n=1 Tax=Sporomusa acidovorans TaxID=112900 RepID=UPI001FE06940|nr:polysaccharide deacetylase family protein [Sporomusa acidovorans]
MPVKKIFQTNRLLFDDGYLDNYTTALPILEKYGLRAAIFLQLTKLASLATCLGNKSTTYRHAG